MIGGEENNLMDELINLEAGGQAGKRYINRKQLVEIVTAMRRDGDEVEEILESLRDYVVDFKNTVDRPMVLPIIQDVDDGRYGAPRKWMNPRDANQVRQATGGIGAHARPASPIPFDHASMNAVGGVAPMMGQAMGITEQIRDMYHKYVEAFQKGDLDSAMFYKNAFQELLEMRNSMYPTLGGGSRSSQEDDFNKQIMLALVQNLMNGNGQQEKQPQKDIMDEFEKMSRMKDLFGWGAPSPGGLSENAAIAAMQVAAPEIGKLTDTVGQLVQHRQQGKQADDNRENFQEMQDKEREIRANYTSCPQCDAVIPKWAKQCHGCGVLFNDQFAGAPSPYGKELPQRQIAGNQNQSVAPSDPGMQGVMGTPSVPQLPQDMMMQQMMQQMYDDYDDGDAMTEQEIWFEQFYPRLEEWISQGADPRRKIQAVWALADVQEQRQLLYLAQYKEVEGLISGLEEFVKTHPEHGQALDFLMQSGSMSFMQMLFNEVTLLANEDNMVLAKQDIFRFEDLWPTPGRMVAQSPTMPMQVNTQMAPMPQEQPQVAPDQAKMLEQMNNSGIPPAGIPQIDLQPPQHIQGQAGSSLKEKLRRKQLGLE